MTVTVTVTVIGKSCGSEVTVAARHTHLEASSRVRPREAVIIVWTGMRVSVMAYLLQGPSTTGNKPPRIERIERIPVSVST